LGAAPPGPAQAPKAVSDLRGRHGRSLLRRRFRRRYRPRVRRDVAGATPHVSGVDEATETDGDLSGQSGAQRKVLGEGRARDRIHVPVRDARRADTRPLPVPAAQRLAWNVGRGPPAAGTHRCTPRDPVGHPLSLARAAAGRPWHYQPRRHRLDDRRRGKRAWRIGDVTGDQSVAARVPFFFKQWGGVHKKKSGRELDGRTWSEFPATSAPPVLEGVLQPNGDTK
jgi:hypothetical protein